MGAPVLNRGESAIATLQGGESLKRRILNETAILGSAISSVSLGNPTGGSQPPRMAGSARGRQPGPRETKPIDPGTKTTPEKQFLRGEGRRNPPPRLESGSWLSGHSVPCDWVSFVIVCFPGNKTGCKRQPHACSGQTQACSTPSCSPFLLLAWRAAQGLALPSLTAGLTLSELLANHELLSKAGLCARVSKPLGFPGQHGPWWWGPHAGQGL